MKLSVSIVIMMLVISGCDGAVAGDDAGGRDDAGSQSDAGGPLTQDAGAADSGTVDGGRTVIDAGVTDAGRIDAGQPTCQQTLSTGSNVASAVAAAPNGSTICLNTGDYGALTFAGFTRTGFVTVRSTAGIGARMKPKVDGVDFVRFESMTLADMLIQNCSTNIEVVSNTWAKDTSGISVFDYGFNCPATNKKILIDRNDFVSTQPAWSEGKIGLVEVNGVTITNNLIEGQSTGNGGDGIQTGGSCNNLTIGPGNIFRNIQQGPCDATTGVPHCDSIQFVGSCPACTITGNWFDDVTVVLQHHDGDVPVVFTNNLITGAVQLWAYGAQANGSRFDHNTFYGVSGFMTFGRNGSGVSTSSGQFGRSNIFLNSVQPLGCTSSCTFTNNLAAAASQNLGTSAINATPVFTGGAASSIATWAGWRLAAGSPGVNAGHDGENVGTLFFGP